MNIHIYLPAAPEKAAGTENRIFAK